MNLTDIIQELANYQKRHEAQSLTEQVHQRIDQHNWFLEAAGYYLAYDLPEDYQELPEEELYALLEETAWEPFENHPGKAIYGFIADAAQTNRNRFTKNYEEFTS